MYKHLVMAFAGLQWETEFWCANFECRMLITVALVVGVVSGA